MVQTDQNGQIWKSSEMVKMAKVDRTSYGDTFAKYKVEQVLGGLPGKGIYRTLRFFSNTWKMFRFRDLMSSFCEIASKWLSERFQPF